MGTRTALSDASDGLRGLWRRVRVGAAWIALATGLTLSAGTATAGGLESLEAFLRSAASGRAEFRQAVTSPGRDGAPPRVRNSSGSFAFARPNRFRFDYAKPFEQVIVADGETLWLHDVDLNQVTARKQAQALGATPAALIASAADMTALRRDFQIDAAPDADGLEWVQAVPRQKDSQITRVRIGFKTGSLSVLEILDSFGQRSVISFTRLELNAAVPASTFQFKPPAGADVMRN